MIDWNYYLERKDGNIFYEGYKNSKFSKDDTTWMMGERIALGKNEASLTVSQDEEGREYPVGVFSADVLDKNG